MTLLLNLEFHVWYDSQIKYILFIFFVCFEGMLFSCYIMYCILLIDENADIVHICSLYEIMAHYIRTFNIRPGQAKHCNILF